MLVEVILYLFIGNVDAELLKRVPFKVLETKYVQDSDGEHVISGKRHIIYLVRPGANFRWHHRIKRSC